MTDSAPPAPDAPGQAPGLAIDTTVAIVGGGLAGMTMAALLGGAGLDVAVIDRESRPDRAAPDFDGRTTAISYATRKVLEGAGLWAPVAGRAAPILDIRIADDAYRPGAPGVSLHFDHREMAGRTGGEPFGHIVENPVLRAAQFDRIDRLSTVRHLSPARVVGLDLPASGAEPGRGTVTLADGTRVSADLVVGADGRGSFVRRAAGIAATRWSYRQEAVVCWFTHERPHHGVALEHFLPAGPFAVLPMLDDAHGRPRSALVWTERPDRAKTLTLGEDAEFRAALQTTLGDWLGAVTGTGRRFRYPLGVVHARRYTAPRLALIGEAAHGIHPIAGQGLNLGLRDAAWLAELVVDAARLGGDPGAAPLLARYERGRRLDNTMMIGVTDALDRLFSTGLPPVRAAREAGLAAVGRLPPLKRLFMGQAMGLAGNARSRLLRDEPL
ncbi:MAG: UbiH/UbiF/VisC/COQ6 family ubiquinone biosynthesis hydroxylase [Azospirillaceae bacterium]